MHSLILQPLLNVGYGGLLLLQVSDVHLAISVERQASLSAEVPVLTPIVRV